MKYTPRRASLKRWLEGAPDYVLDCFDDKRTGDRYTVMFTGKLLITADPTTVRFIGSLSSTFVQYLGMSGAPTHPQGISLWGSLNAYDAAAYRRRNSHLRIKWLDLPENIRAHVRRRAEED